MSEDISENLSADLISSPLFSELTEDEIDIITPFLNPIIIKEGEVILREDDNGEEMYILYSGSLRATAKQSDGNERWLFDIKDRGEFFGEMSIIDHEPRSATISAAEDSTLLMLEESDFYSIIKHPMVGFKILKAISVVQNQRLDQTSKSYSDLIRWGETARRRAITDEMTGLYNRSFLEDSIKERFSNSSMDFRTMSLLLMDLDRIHEINNRYGTKAGDLVITEAANLIRSCLRPADIPSRLAGDEFAILLPDTEQNDAAKVAERIRETISDQKIEVPKRDEEDETVFIETRVSIGIAMAPAHAATTDEFINVADKALKKAKELGRNRVEVFCGN